MNLCIWPREVTILLIETRKLNQGWFNVGLTSATLAQHLTILGSDLVFARYPLYGITQFYSHNNVPEYVLFIV